MGYCQFLDNSRPVGRLGLGSGPHAVSRLGSGMRVSASFQIIPRPVGRLGLGLGQNPTSWVSYDQDTELGRGLSPIDRQVALAIVPIDRTYITALCSFYCLVCWSVVNMSACVHTFRYIVTRICDCA